MTLSRLRFRALPLLVAAAAFGAFAAPASAQSPGPYPPPPGTGSYPPPPPPCEIGQVPTPERPCMPPPCPEGTAPTPDKPCMIMGPGPGPYPGPGGPGACGPGGPGGPSGPGGVPGGAPGAVKSAAPGGPGGDCGPPEMDRGFMNRVWKFVGEVDGYDEGVLSMTVAKILNLPKKFSDERDEIVDEDAAVLIGRTTRIFDEDGKRMDAAGLDSAKTVRVHGKMLKTSKWRKDEDDQPIPTIRAKKVYVLS